MKLASEFFKEATMRTNRKVGDGTSATTVIAGKLFNELYKTIHAGRRSWTRTRSFKTPPCTPRSGRTGELQLQR